jgi:hypothetical protein
MWMRQLRSRRALAALGSAIVVASVFSATLLAQQPARSLAQAAVSGNPGAGGTLVHVANCEQAPAQSVKDRATYTPAELARYGLPPRLPGEGFARWARIVRTAGRRVCDYYRGAPGQKFAADVTRRATAPSAPLIFASQKSDIWAGYAATDDLPSQYYSEADMDYYIPQITGNPTSDFNTAVMASWIGLGGAYGDTLVQTGTDATETHGPSGWVTTYRAWWVNTSAGAPHYWTVPVSYGQHMYVSVWTDSTKGGCMYLQRISDGKNTGVNCELPNSTGSSAEAIVEWNRAMGPNFANFGQQTFYGVGITDTYNGVKTYYAMNNIPRGSYVERTLARCNGKFPPGQCPQSALGSTLASPGGISYDAGDSPYDEYTVYWDQYH